MGLSVYDKKRGERTVCVIVTLYVSIIPITSMFTAKVNSSNCTIFFLTCLIGIELVIILIKNCSIA